MSTEFSSEYLLRDLDAPLMWLFWTGDEILSALVPFIGGFVLGHIVIGAITGFVFFRLLKSLKKRMGNDRGVLAQAKYKYFPTGKSGLPDSTVEEYLT